MGLTRRIAPHLALGFGLALVQPALAQDDRPVPFEGGTLTVAEQPDSSKVVAYEGRELGRGFVVLHDGVWQVRGVNIALFTLGDGGNACGARTLIVWKAGAEITSTTVGEGCDGAPPAAVSQNAVYFVPALVPGTDGEVSSWTPEDGLKVAGRMTFTPQPGTGWEQLEGKAPEHIIDAFDNAAVYAAAQEMLGSELQDMATSLLTSGTPQTLATGEIVGDGCVPHACSIRDGFMAIDPVDRKLYFAQQQQGAEPRTWPDVGEWPEEIREAMHKALVGN